MVEIRPVRFPSGPFTLAGALFLPEGFEESGSYPALVIAHPEGSVKEQAPALYAQKLAEQGFVALTFDGAYMGESSGEPHFTTDPAQRVEDIRCAVDYLTTLPFVNQERLGGLGICAGGAYMIDAAKTEKRFAAIGAVVPVDMGAGMREGQADKQALLQTLQAAAATRSAQVAGAETMLIDTVAASDEDAEKFPARSLFREARSYYRGVAEHERSTGQIVFSGMDKLLRYNPFDLMPLMWSHPLLVIATVRVAGTAGD